MRELNDEKISNITVNGFSSIEHAFQRNFYGRLEKPKKTILLKWPFYQCKRYFGSKKVQIACSKLGWKNTKKFYWPDTTFRDAHKVTGNSRCAHRFFEFIAGRNRKKPSAIVFFREVLGGPLSMLLIRFLMEDSWERLKGVKERMPKLSPSNVVLGSNASRIIKNYPW